jgi:hypothetical protein
MNRLVCSAPCSLVQVVAHAYAEPMEKNKKAASMSMKVTLVTLDCLFLGKHGLQGQTDGLGPGQTPEIHSPVLLN